MGIAAAGAAATAAGCAAAAVAADGLVPGAAVMPLAARRLGRRFGLGMARWVMPLALAFQAAAQPGVPANPPAAAAEAGQWLARIQGAADNRNYQGTMVVSFGATVSSSRVTHICDGRQRYERIEVLDGRARSQFRHNEQLLTLWPGSKLAVFEQRDPIIDFPGLPSAAGQRAVESYELRWVGSDRIAGHEADVLMVKPRDGLRFAQRWWAERDTGLLLRADTLGAKGEVLESSAFTDLSLAGKAAPDLVLGPMKRLDGWRVVRASAERTQLEAEGWTLSRAVPGFQPVSCAKRPLDAAADDAPGRQVLQTVFSDGLAHVSVFIEPFDAQRHKQAMRTSLGATHTVSGRHGDWWVTVMGEVPMATVQQFEAVIERRR